MDDLFSNIQKINISEFSLEKNLKLKSLALAYLIMTRSNDYLDEFVTFLTEKLRCDDHFRTKNEEYFYFIIDFVLSKGMLAEEIFRNYLFNGFVYHSYNGAFTDSIKERGLVLKNKPWDLVELEEIRRIFNRHGKNDIFGLYQGEEKTPIFMAKSIMSSSFYAISSPTWFLHFTTGGMKEQDYDKEAYRNRDYDGCLKNIIIMCDKYGLSNDERNRVIGFFNKYYNYLGLNESPGILLMKRSKFDSINIPLKNDDESERDYIIRTLRINCSGNIMIRENIKKEDILIIKYNVERRIEL